MEKENKEEYTAVRFPLGIDNTRLLLVNQVQHPSWQALHSLQEQEKEKEMGKELGKEEEKLCLEEHIQLMLFEIYPFSKL